MSWNEGYRTDIQYTYGYYSEINPVNMRLAMTLAGLDSPEVKNACELGYGQGISINIHAAAEANDWQGTDFNPSQAAFARRLARTSGANAHCHALSFKEFCELDDLPYFDYIALHGIWSWISPENQAEIAHLIDRKLKIGGVLYISYNTYPGWTDMRPARDLMMLFDSHMASPGAPVLERVGAAMDFMGKLFAAKPGFLARNPNVASRFEAMQKQDRHYLAHEFFNSIWEPNYFYEMAETLDEARMSYACSASLLDFIPNIGLSPEQAALLQGIADPVMRETVRDFIRNTQFRKDYWVKGPRPLGGHERMERLRECQFILTAPAQTLTREVQGAFGKMTLSEPSFNAFMQVMGDGRQHTVQELEKAAQAAAGAPDASEDAKKLNIWTMLQAAALFCQAAQAAPVQDKATSSKAQVACDRLNACIENLALDGSQIQFLASPLTGGGIPANRFEQIFLQALRRGAKNAPAMAAFARDSLNALGQKPLKDGKPIESQEEILQMLTEQAEKFLPRLQVLKNLKIA